MDVAAMVTSIVPEDAVVAVVWMLRVILPFLLLWVSFGPKLSFPWQHRRRIKRDILLAHRQLVMQEAEQTGAGRPPSMTNLMLVDETTAPTLFQKPEDRPPRERGVGGGKGAGKNRRDDRRDRGQRTAGGDAVPAVPTTSEATPVSAPEQLEEEHAVETRRLEKAAAETRMHVESLVNFAAFSRARRENQRVFLVEPGEAPLPPRHPATRHEAPVPQSTADQVNTEAQMILNGTLALGSRGSNIAKDLFSHLDTEQGVILAPETFELMIQTCVQARDLSASSEFLMRMEAMGKIPSNELIDHVMQLYLERRQESQDDASPAEKNETVQPEDGDEEEEMPRSRPPMPAFAIPDEYSTEAREKRLPADSTTLSADAAIFVPSFGPTSTNTATEAAKDSVWSLDSSWEGSASHSSEAALRQRFALSAKAAVFTPSGSGNWAALDNQTEDEKAAWNPPAKKGASFNPKAKGFVLGQGLVDCIEGAEGTEAREPNDDEREEGAIYST